MFHVTVDGQDKCVQFRHDYEVRHIIQKDGVAVDQRQPVKTSCSIISDDGILGEGVAMCDPRDQFEYAVGRKRALKRALIAAGFDRKARAAVWNVFIGN